MPAGNVRNVIGGLIMDYARNKRYFSPGLYKLSAVVLVIGFFLFLAGLITMLFVASAAVSIAVEGNVEPFVEPPKEIEQIVSAGGVAMVIGGVLFVGGLVWLIILHIRRPKEAQIDEQVQAEVKQLYRKALSKHSITEEMVQRSAPLILGGYVLDEKTTAKLFTKRFVAKVVVSGKAVSTVVDPTVALGSVMSASVIVVDEMSVIKHIRAPKDGTVRSALAEYTIFLFSEDNVFVYTQQFSLVDPEIKESAHKYAYRDIVSVSSEALKYGSHAFIVKASNGETLTVPCSNAKATDIRDSVTAFMQLVRNKKNS